MVYIDAEFLVAVLNKCLFSLASFVAGLGHQYFSPEFSLEVSFNTVLSLKTWELL